MQSDTFNCSLFQSHYNFALLDSFKLKQLAFVLVAPHPVRQAAHRTHSIETFMQIIQLRKIATRCEIV